MSNPHISRPQVHRLAEACGEQTDAFQSTAYRLTRQQRTLSRFFEQNFETMGPMAGQAALYMLAVTIRIFEQVGGRMKKVSGKDIIESTKRIQPFIDSLRPADKGFCQRAKASQGRAQPHILDEVLWALYERKDESDSEVDLDLEQSALVYFMLWTAVECLDANWTPPQGWVPTDGVDG